MKRLIVYYSRTGMTRKVAEDMAKELKCDIEEIKDTIDRSGAFGYLRAGQDATFQKETVIAPIQKNPKDYDLIIIGTPVWVYTMSCAVRSYINEFMRSIPDVAFFCTQGSSGSKRTFKHMEDLIGKKPLATLSLFTHEVKRETHKDKLKRFIAKVKK